MSIRGGLRRLGAFGRVHRLAVFGVCVTLTGWSWWSAQSTGYAGLPVNTLGQIGGDFLLMGLVAPLARHEAARSRERSAERNRHRDAEAAANLSPLGALALAAHRIQLLDVRLCFPQLTDAVPDAGSAQPSSSPGSGDGDVPDLPLPRALESALANDACVEILLPDPEEFAGLDFAQRFGILPARYRGALSKFVHDLDTLSAAAETGRLDLRLYAEPSNVSLVRSDRRIWVSLHPESPADAPDYLALDQAGENTQVLQAYFNRLYVTARAPKRSRGDPADPDADPGVARGAAAVAAVACRG